VEQKQLSIFVVPSFSMYGSRFLIFFFSEAKPGVAIEVSYYNYLKS